MRFAFAFITLPRVHLTAGDYIYPLSVGEWNHSRRGKLRHKRPKPRGSSDSYASPGPKSSWPSSESSQPQIGAVYGQTSPLQEAPHYSTMAAQPGAEQALRPQQLPGAIPMMPPDQNQFTFNFGVIESAGVQPIQMEPIQNFPNLQPMAPAPTLHPYMTPVMALIVPNYPALTSGFPSIYPPPASSILPQAPINMAAIVPGSMHFPLPLFQAQPTPQAQTTLRPLLCSPGASSSIGDEEEAAAGPPALFSSSRSSSPLQLNLLQEELPKPNEGQGSTGHDYSESLHDQRVNEVGRVDGHSSSSTGSNLCQSFSRLGSISYS